MELVIIVLLSFSVIIIVGWTLWGILFGLGILPIWLAWALFGFLVLGHLRIGWFWWELAVFHASGPRGFFIEPGGTLVDAVIWIIFWPLLAPLRMIVHAIKWRP